MAAAKRQTTRLSFLLLPLILLAACGGQPTRESPDREPSGGVEAALAAFEAGRYGEAMTRYEALAATEGARRDHWLLRAAAAALEGGDQTNARRLLAILDARRLSPHDRAQADLLTAAVDRDRLPPHRLLGLLEGAADQLVPDDRPLYYELRATALAASGQPYAAALERVRLARLLPESPRAAANREATLKVLQQLTADQARRLLERHARGDPMRGWLDLTATVKESVFAGTDPASAVAAWRARFPDHPAGREVADRVIADYDRGFSMPGAIAVLLPETGPLAGASRAIRDGLMAAFFDQGAGAAIRFYDSGPAPAAALTAFRRALADGAAAIIGPLDREAVTAVLLEADGRVPVLALNYSDLEAPTAPAVYQFGLLPEHEAAAAAERMLADGHERASVLTPNSPWGDRLRDAFVRRFVRLGGVVFDQSVYPDGASDFGPTIERLVGLQAAEVRRRALQTDLGLRLNFEAVRRSDLDALFLAARPRVARLIKPQLAFHSAGGLPVYATSHVFTGTVAPKDDEDLDRIRFCDAPWVIGTQGFRFELDDARDAFPSADGGAARLFALGYDSFRLLPYLDWLARFPEDRFPGATGQLAIGPGGRIDRLPDCAEFRRGTPRYLAPAGEAIAGLAR